jgi:hypothetical protein
LSLCRRLSHWLSLILHLLKITIRAEMGRVVGGEF